MESALCAWHTVRNQMLALFITSRTERKLVFSFPQCWLPAQLPCPHQCHCYHLSWDFWTSWIYSSLSNPILGSHQILLTFPLKFLLNFCVLLHLPWSVLIQFPGSFSLACGPLLKTIFLRNTSQFIHLQMHSVSYTLRAYCVLGRHPATFLLMFMSSALLRIKGK